MTPVSLVRATRGVTRMPLPGRGREYRLKLRSLSSLPSRNCQTLGGREEERRPLR